MKTNAIIRIVIWSLVIIVLLGILSIGLGVTRILPSKTIAASPAETVIPQRIEEPEPTTETYYTLKETTNIRTKPSPLGEVLGIVEAGQRVYLTRVQTIDGHRWGYLLEPETGWIVLVSGDEASDTPVTVPPETLSPETASPETLAPEISGNTWLNSEGNTQDDSEPHVQQGSEASYTLDASKIDRIKVEWGVGSIAIFPTDGEEILAYETGDTNKYPMTVEEKKGKLTISFCDERSMGLGINFNKSKDLTILVPSHWECRELEIEAGSATVQLQGLTIREMEFDGGSGACEFIDCMVGTLDIDTASGDISFSGSLDVLECDAASASFEGEFTNVPQSLEMESMSGNLDISLPEDAGFTVSMESMQSDFSSEFETTARNNTYVSGDGRCRIQMEAMSGDVIIRKN